MESNGYELIVSQPANPTWKIILSGICFAIAIHSILTIMLLPNFANPAPEEIVIFNKSIVLTIVGIVIGIYFSVRLTILIDVDSNQLVSRYFLGFFSFNRRSEILGLSHVAVAKNRDGIYLINLWHDASKPYNMCYCEEKSTAFNFAASVAEKLQIDLLDATEKGNPKWIEKTAP
jgi:hypothetical protein